jgi:uncharacterized membrane protein
MGATFKRWWYYIWRFMMTGLLVWVPLIITAWVSWVAISKLGFGLDNLGRGIVSRLQEIGAGIPALGVLERLHYLPGMGLIAAFTLFFFTGFLTRYLVGRKIIASGEQLIQRIPLVSRVYRSVQQVRDVFIGRGGAVFQSVCLVQYPRPGMFAVGFVTAREQGVIQEVAGRELLAVFVPTTPNPTSGYLVYVAPEEVTQLDVSVEEAMKVIFSGGAYLPASRQVLTPDTITPMEEDVT